MPLPFRTEETVHRGQAGRRSLCIEDKFGGGACAQGEEEGPVHREMGEEEPVHKEMKEEGLYTGREGKL